MQREDGQPVAAAVKNRLLRLTDRTFSEPALGHPNFRAFLQAAEGAGIVALMPTTGGDVEVLLPGQSQHPGTARRIRRDFWNAFIKWDDGRTRLYDREANRVITIESSAASALRAADEHRYVPIPPPARAATVESMRKFLEQVPQEARAGLEEILDGTGGVEKKFVDALPLEARAAWRSVTAWQVMSRAEAWRKENGVDVDLHSDPTASARPAPSTAASARSTDRPELGEEAIRRRVVSAVQRMPLSALLQLPIPVEYLLADEAP